MLYLLLAESPEDLQTSLNTMTDYCSILDFDIIIDIYDFYKRETTKTPLFYYGDQNIKVVNEYNYLRFYGDQNIKVVNEYNYLRFYGDQNIKVVNEYNYLRLIFNYSAKFM